MSNILKTFLYTAVAAGVAVAGWRLARRASKGAGRGASPSPPEEHKPSTNGDLTGPGGPGAAGELTKEQREKMLQELEDQLGA